MNECKIKDYQIVVFGLIIAVSSVISAGILTNGIIKYQKLQNQTITVTGSSSEEIQSDNAILEVGYKAQAKNLKEGYALMAKNKEKITDYLVQNGINKNNITFGQISNYEVNKRIGNYTTNDIEFYRFNSDVKIKSDDVNKIEKLSQNIYELINSDVEVSYTNVQYLVSNLDSIKVKMVGEATKNAKERAESMVKSTNDKIGSLNSAKTGVFQIVPVDSTDVSDYGINDTTSIKKKIVAVVNATFTVK